MKTLIKLTFILFLSLGCVMMNELKAQNFPQKQISINDTLQYKELLIYTNFLKWHLEVDNIDGTVTLPKEEKQITYTSITSALSTFTNEGLQVIDRTVIRDGSNIQYYYLIAKKKSSSRKIWFTTL
jgi:hypothetical protein